MQLNYPGENESSTMQNLTRSFKTVLLPASPTTRWRFRETLIGDLLGPKIRTLGTSELTEWPIHPWSAEG